MTKLEALTELAAKVEAGCIPKRDLVSAAFAHRDEKYKGFRLGELIHWIMQPDDIRAMGAARALHEAVLPGWDIQITTYEDDSFEASVARPMEVRTYDGVSMYMARAWLLAIIRALIAEEEA